MPDRLKPLFLVVGARPNFMKAAPLYAALTQRGRRAVICHTGQHYDYGMSQAFFEDLEMPEADFTLGVGSGSHAQQTARTMLELEKVLLDVQPALVVVFGDVNSTLAATLTAAKIHLPVAHVEAGLRSFDDTMPEEMNRRLTDALAQFLFTPSKDADVNLQAEGIAADRMYLVGNIMIDSLKQVLAKLTFKEELTLLQRFQVKPQSYGLVTLHRPHNVDHPRVFGNIMEVLAGISRKCPLVFPMHPRTRKQLRESGFPEKDHDRLLLIDPLRYREFITLEKQAAFVVTDSGGVQEETTWLRIPCFTLRPNTERPITIEMGTNCLTTVDTLPDMVEDQIFSRPAEEKPSPGPPPLWDGRTAERIAGILA